MTSKHIFTGCCGLMYLKNTSEWHHKVLHICRLTCSKCGTSWNTIFERGFEVLEANGQLNEAHNE